MELESEVDEEKDLPLMANAMEIRVRHYKLKLKASYVESNSVLLAALIFLVSSFAVRF